MNNGKHLDQLDLTGFDREDLEEKLRELTDKKTDINAQLNDKSNIDEDWRWRAKHARRCVVRNIRKINKLLAIIAEDRHKQHLLLLGKEQKQAAIAKELRKQTNIEHAKMQDAEHQKKFIAIAKRVLPSDMYELVMGEFKRVNSLET